MARKHFGLWQNMYSGYLSKKIRLEGHTRQDNLAMRKTFERAGFVKEAHLRKAWFSPKENSYYDAVTYGITREDFMGGTTTPVIWEDGEKSRICNLLVFRTFQMSFESERLVIRAPELGMQQDVWNAIRKFVAGTSESGCHGRNRNRSYI